MQNLRRTSTSMDTSALSSLVPQQARWIWWCADRASMTHQWQERITTVGLFTLFLLLLATIQFATPNLVGTDGYFHIRFAQIMREQGIRPEFPWLPLTVLNAEEYADHHLLYHILLIPFTGGDLRLGAKWAAILFPAMAFVVGYRFLRSQGVSMAALWSLGFFALSQPFLYRLNMTRVQGASLLILLLILQVTVARRYRWLGAYLFLYVWLYDGFFFGVVVVGCHLLMRWLLEGELAWRPLLYVTLGVLLGHLLNPYFPNNIYFTVQHVLTKVITPFAAGSPIRVGNEWQPYSTWGLVEHSLPALLAFVAGTFALGLQKQRMETTTATLFLLTLFFGFTLFRSRRFIEYYPAFALLFCAMAWQPLLAKASHAKRWGKLVVALLLLLIIVPASWYNIQQTRRILAVSTPYTRFAEATAWLQSHSPPNSRVFQSDWDLFPQLFFHNQHNSYVAGLDPTYQQQYRADLYDLWRQITRGEIELPGLLIQSMFGAEYLFADLEHQLLIDRARIDPHLVEVYRDHDAVIFQVR